MGDKKYILNRRLNLERWDRSERKRLLDAHVTLRVQLMLALADDCERDGGHEWKPLPNNEANAPHFATGEWPQACQWCGASKPRSE